MGNRIKGESLVLVVESLMCAAENREVPLTGQGRFVSIMKNFLSAVLNILLRLLEQVKSPLKWPKPVLVPVRLPRPKNS